MGGSLPRSDALDRLHVLHMHQRLELAARAGRLGIWDYDINNGDIHCDDQWLRTMGLPAGREALTIEEFRSIIHPDDVDIATADTRQTAEMLLASASDYSIEFRIRRPDGEIRWIRSTACILTDVDQTPSRAVGFVTDITDSHLAAQRLERLNQLLQNQNDELQRYAFVDHLTGVANRRRFDDELFRAHDQAQRSGHPLAVALIDVDHFKTYNDCFGHAQGDIALKAVAETIAACAWRPYDLAARYGGEEFALILPDTRSPASLLERIRSNVSALAIPHPKSPTSSHLTISCGCCVVSGTDINPEQTVKSSDAALYRAKKQGRNQIVIAGAP